MTRASRTPMGILTLAGLALISLWLLASPPAGHSVPALTRLAIGAAASAPLIVLLITGLRPASRWGAWVSIVLIPYFTLSVGAMLMEPGDRVPGALFAALVAVVFFGGIYTVRGR